MGFNACFKMISASALGGGGGVTSPTLEVGLTLAETAATLELDIVNNDDDNPAALELAFSATALSSVSTVQGQGLGYSGDVGFDDGTAVSPSYGLDPGSTRQVVFVRGTSSPSYGDDDVVETVTATLADGSTVSTSVTVEGPFFKTAVREISTPTFEFLMDAVDMTGNLVNVGSLGASYNAGLYNCAVAVDVSDGFHGYVEADGASDYCKAVFGAYPTAADTLRVENRSYIFVWDNEDDIPSNKYLTIATAGSTNNAWGWMQSNASGGFKSQYLWSGSATDLSAANGTNDNMAGSAETLASTDDDGDPRRCLLVVSYDHAAEAATVRWKQGGHGVGHTYITDDIGTADSSAGAAVMAWFGWSSGAASTVRWRYIAIIDSTVSSAQFEALAGHVIT